MLALLAENGPCNINDDGNVTSPNPYSWNKNAHGVWVDQPPGSGFSTGYGDVDEAEVAFDMYRFIQAFFQVRGRGGVAASQPAMQCRLARPGDHCCARAAELQAQLSLSL